MSANLPSRGNRPQGPEGRPVEHAERPGAGEPTGGGAAHGRSAAGRGREGRSRAPRPNEGRSREGRSRAPRQPSAMDTSAMDVGRDVRAGQLGGKGSGGTGQEPSDTDRRRLRTQRALRSPRAVRQAILLREILGPPVALRRHKEDPPSLSD